MIQRCLRSRSLRKCILISLRIDQIAGCNEFFDGSIVLRFTEAECSVCIFATECKFIAVLVLCEIDPELEGSGIQVLCSSFQGFQIDCGIQIAFAAGFFLNSYNLLVGYGNHPAMNIPSFCW